MLYRDLELKIYFFYNYGFCITYINANVHVLQIGIQQVELYNLSCPFQGNWKFRAEVYCNSTSKYFCLFNNAEGEYVEGCDGPDWDRKGLVYIL